MVPAPSQVGLSAKTTSAEWLESRRDQLLAAILCAAGVGFLLAVLVPLYIGTGTWGVTIALSNAILLFIVGLVHWLIKRHAAFRNHRPVTDLFLGLVRLVLWDPTEGVLVLRNKKVAFVDQEIRDGGGVAYLFPVLGDELVVRVPLTVQSVEFRDENVFTRDSIPLFVRVMMFWRVEDLAKFYLLVSQEVHIATDDPMHRDAQVDVRRPLREAPTKNQLRTAERWITTTAEEETRTYVSEISTSLLVTEHILAEVPAARELVQQGSISSPGGQDRERTRGLEESLGTYQTASNLLTERLRPRLNAKLGPSGLHIDRVGLQEVRLPPGIHEKAVDAAKAWYGLIEAQREGRGEASKLEALTRILGKEAVGLTEIYKHAEGMKFVGFDTVFDRLFKTFGEAK